MHSPDGDDANDPANYVTRNANGVSHRIMLNGGTAAERAQMIRASIPDGDRFPVQSNGDFKIPCPFHDDSDPSCSFSPHKRVYYCHGCGAKGTFMKLLTALTGSKATGIQRIARATGQTVEFHQPDSTAIAKYDYRDINGNLKKRVLRFPDDENGGKVISQRRWTKDGWVPGIKGLGPLLYNADLLKAAGTVILVEGEKDADSVTRLHLGGYGGETIGVTSGGSRSWHAKLAKQLRGKPVIVMPDNDAPGEAYAEAVRASLDAEHIKYKTVSFAGTGAKDVTEYLEHGHTTEDLVQLIDSDWVSMPDGSHPAMGNELPNDAFTDADLVPA